MKYRVGLVGASRGSSLAAPFAALPETEIAALCDLNEARLVEAARHFNVPDRRVYSDFDRFLDAPLDIIVVGTPIQFHAEQSINALESGRHVLSEVTMAYTVEDCRRIIEAVKRTGKRYMMAENCCYWPFIRQWKAWLRGGRIGDVFYAEAEYIHNIQALLRDEKSGETYWRLNRPPLYYCSHSLGPLLFLMDDRIVSACGADCGTGIMPDLGPGCLNMEVALFKTQKGAVIKLLRSQVAYRPSMHYYSLYGTQGCLETDRIGGWGDRRGLLHERGEGEDHWDEIDCLIAKKDASPEELSGGHGTAEYDLARDFVEAVQAGAQPPIDAVWAASFTAPGIIAHASAQSGGQWLDVPMFSW